MSRQLRPIITRSEAPLDQKTTQNIRPRPRDNSNSYAKGAYRLFRPLSSRRIVLVRCFAPSASRPNPAPPLARRLESREPLLPLERDRSGIVQLTTYVARRISWTQGDDGRDWRKRGVAPGTQHNITIRHQRHVGARTDSWDYRVVTHGVVKKAAQNGTPTSPGP